MKQTGIDFALDIHADEELPHVFVANVDRIVPPSPAIAAICDTYEILLGQEDPFFKPKAGYVRRHTKSEPLSFCSPHIMHRLGAPAVTLELPHKRFEAGTDREQEYGVPGCIGTGRASLSALAKMIDDLLRLKAAREPTENGSLA